MADKQGNIAHAVINRFQHVKSPMQQLETFKKPQKSFKKPSKAAELLNF
jgi:hypothetical protein